MKILIYRPDGAIKECDNIEGFLHMTDGIIQFTHHDINGVIEAVRTSMPWVIIAESNAEIEVCDKSYGTEKGE